jgi:RNA polymerase primary sigma factor
MTRPPVDEAHERRLLRAAQRGERRARDRIVSSRLTLVHSAARRYLNLGLPLEDLVQEGAVGLLEAIDRFDLTSGDFERFARFRIRRSMRNALTERSRLVRLPKHVVERRRALARASGEGARTVVALAAATGLSLQAVTDALNAESTPVSLDLAEISTIDPSIPDPALLVVEHDSAERLEAALASLPDRQQQIVRQVFGLDGPSCCIGAVAAELGLSRERTRALLRSGLAELRTTLAAG